MIRWRPAVNDVAAELMDNHPAPQYHHGMMPDIQDAEDWGTEAVKRVADRFRKKDEDRDRRLRARYQLAREQLGGAVDIARRFPGVRRVITWGSILRPHQFTELSDVDICIEGVSSPEDWNRLERTLLDAVTLPLDLVRWEELSPPHRESIIARGKVLYEHR